MQINKIKLFSTLGCVAAVGVATVLFAPKIAVVAFAVLAIIATLKFLNSVSKIRQYEWMKLADKKEFETKETLPVLNNEQFKNKADNLEEITDENYQTILNEWKMQAYHEPEIAETWYGGKGKWKRTQSSIKIRHLLNLFEIDHPEQFYTKIDKLVLWFFHQNSPPVQSN